MHSNLWQQYAGQLEPAYDRKADSLPGRVRFEVVTRALLTHLPPGKHRILDIGGGCGYQAIALAQAGHEVVVVDPDQQMLNSVSKKLDHADEAVRARITLINAEGEQARTAAGNNFDLVCCHSVLMYLDSPNAMLKSIVDCAQQDGLISILSLNTHALAMRPALQKNWHGANSIILQQPYERTSTLPIKSHSQQKITSILRTNGAKPVAWYGVSIFTDHLADEYPADDLAAITELEWHAGCHDPYRKIGRQFHLIAKKNR